MKTNTERAKDYCKEYRYKLEDISGDLFIASDIIITKSWDKRFKQSLTKSRVFNAFQIMEDGDIVLIKNKLGGNHNISTSIVFTSLILNELKECMIK